MCDSICNSTCLFADDSDIFCCISNMKDCKFWQSHNDSVHKWCLDNGKNPDEVKTTFIFFTCKMNSIAFRYKLGLTYLAHSPYVTDLGVLLDCRLYFHNHVVHIVAQAFGVLGLICYIVFFFFHRHSHYCVLCSCLF